MKNIYSIDMCSDQKLKLRKLITEILIPYKKELLIVSAKRC